jgi:hypothetical protein
MIGPDHDHGLIPRILESLFDSIENRKNMSTNWNATLQVSFLEIYNEKIQDLLVQTEPTMGTGFNLVPPKKKDLGKSCNRVTN